MKIYDDYFGFGNQAEAVRLAKQAGVNNERDISLYAHLVRTNIHIKSLHEIEEKSGRKIPYLPHISRVLLVNKICDIYEDRRLPIARKIIKKLELSERERREALGCTPL